MNDGSSTILVVPCYNEAARLDVDTFGQFVDANTGVSFLFVNDGSVDDTSTVIDGLADRSNRMWSHHLDVNSGKAEAVRQGLLYCIEQGYDRIGYWDADLSTPLDELHCFNNVLDKCESIDIVTAARIKMVGRRIERNPFRHYSGRAFATAVSVLFGIEMYDTQCGAKVFRNTPDLKRVLIEPFQTRWIFDVEILVRYFSAPGKSISENLVEIPLREWRDVAGSKMRPFDFLHAPLELLRIHFTYFNRF